ncbi:MAG: 30S ribosome-binding factor RbfA [Gammaproteobacteria bacterium]|nr:30S ribosome-binding factor RbfA [Gammaproteobacteria bacterium]
MSRRRGRAPSQRQLRVGEAVRHALARIFERSDMRDPALRGVPITVTEVRMSGDLKSAVAFVTPLGGANAGEICAALRRAAPYFRGLVAREVEIKFVPEIRFELDRSFDEARRIEELLRRPEVARDLGPSKDGGGRQGNG